MAGGMNKRGSYGSMAERVARTTPEAPAASADARTAPAEVPEAPRLRHCWVTDRHGRLPGLLLEWRRRPDGWHAKVVHAVADVEGWVVVEEWLPAGLLDPVDHTAHEPGSTG
jgi:hypothetical protein